MAVVIVTGNRKLPVNLRVEQNFRDRAGWAVIATMTDEDGTNPRDYEWTKQHPSPHDAMEALTGFLRVATVEAEAEDDT